MVDELQKILSTTEEFLKGVGENTFADREFIFTEDVIVKTSIKGQGIGRQAVRELLVYPELNDCEIKQNVENQMTHYHDKYAKQSFHMLMMVKKEICGQFHYLQYGGTFILQYIQVGSEWKISEVIYDLTWTEGNSYWICDWKPINYSKPIVYKTMAWPERDGVFHCIPDSDDMNDKKEITEKLFVYGWVVDTEDYPLLYQYTTEDFAVWDGYHGTLTEGAKGWENVLRSLHSNEPVLHHTLKVWDVQINGDKALARMSRMEPNRILNRTIHEKNWKHDFYTLDYEVECRKCEGCWKLVRVSNHPVDVYEKVSTAHFYVRK